MTTAATIDVSAVETRSDDVLGEQIALADTMFARARLVEPRRTFEEST